MSNNTLAVDASLDAETQGSFFQRLYTGAGGFNIVGRAKLWYQIAAVVLLISIAAMGIRGFSLGIDFEGGTRMTMPPASVTTEQAEEVFSKATGVSPELVQIIGSGDGRVLEITSTRLSEDQINQARVALNDAFKPVDATGEQTPDAIGDSSVSESWGKAITDRMLIAGAVFLALVFAYIAIRFQRDMAIAAILALFVDGIVIMGIYALIGLDVTPATIIGLLTVLSFSIYDTVVVFDKVDENTAGYRSSKRRTYGELVNLAINQTIMRSINTSVSTLLPIVALMVIAVGLLGVGTLKDLALVQMIGIIQGTFSSVFLAAPILVTLKSLQKPFQEHDRAVAEYRASAGSAESAQASGEPASDAGTGAESESAEASASPKQLKYKDPDPASQRPLSWRPGQPRS